MYSPTFMLISFVITSWSRGIPETLTYPQLLKKFAEFYGTSRFIIAFTSARHLSLSWARWTSLFPHPHSLISILIVSTSLRLVLPSRFPNKTPINATCAVHFSQFTYMAKLFCRWRLPLRTLRKEDGWFCLSLDVMVICPHWSFAAVSKINK